MYEELGEGGCRDSARFTLSLGYMFFCCGRPDDAETWYRRALENPDVRVTREGVTTDYRAVPVSDAEHERLLDESGFPLVAYFFTGFAPRQFLRLDPS